MFDLKQKTTNHHKASAAGFDINSQKIQGVNITFKFHVRKKRVSNRKQMKRQKEKLNIIILTGSLTACLIRSVGKGQSAGHCQQEAAFKYLSGHTTGSPDEWWNSTRHKPSPSDVSQREFNKPGLSYIYMNMSGLDESWVELPINASLIYFLDINLVQSLPYLLMTHL